MEQHMKKALYYTDVVQRWLQGLEADDDIAPEDNASQGGCTNCTQSSTKREKLRERILRAELEEMIAKEENALEEQMLKLKKEKRKMNIKYEKEEIRRLEQKLKKEQSQVHHSTANYVNKNVASQPLYSPQYILSLPNNEPDVFDGTVTSYKPFILAFESTIEKVCNDYKDRYYYLQRYTSGYPHKLVKSFYLRISLLVNLRPEPCCTNTTVMK